MTEASAPPPEKPDQIGPYRIEGFLGHGGMGQVWLGRHLETGRKAAVKVLSSTTDRQAFKRFQREIEGCSRLLHPNVVRILDWGGHEGRPYYAMELLAAPDLLRLIEAGEAFPVQRVLRLALGLTRGLAAIHEAGILHRDLKPANVILAPKDRIVITDFGLVKDPEQTTLTATGALVGTPRYLAPETWRGEETTKATDVYQCGLVLYEVLAGEQAFPGETIAAVSHACLEGKLPPLAERRPDAPPPLLALVESCLRLAPSERPPDGPALVRALEAMCPGVSQERPPIKESLPEARPLTPPRADEPALAAAMAKGKAPSRRRLALIAFLYAPALLFLLWRSGAPRLSESPEGEVRSLQIETGFTKARLTWRSSRDYPSTILLRDPDLPSPRLVQGTGLREHGVIVNDLRPGRRHELAVVLPGGKTTSPRDLLIPPLRIRTLAAEAGASALTIDWSSSLPLRGQLRARLGQSWYESPMGAKGLEHHSIISRPGRGIRRLELLLLSPLGEERRIDLSAQLAERVRRTAAILDFDAETFINSIGFTDRPPAVDAARAIGLPDEAPVDEKDHESRRRRFRKAFEGSVRKHRWLEEENDLRKLLPFLLDAEFLPLSPRRKLYRGLAMLRYLDYTNRDCNFGVELPFATALGPYGSLPSSRLVAPRIFRHELKPPLRLQSYNPLHPAPHETRWILAVEGATRAERAELAFGFARIRRHPFIVVHVNGRGPIFVFPPMKTEENPSLHTAVPPEYLREGRNEIHFEMRQLPAGFTTRIADVKWVAFLVEP